MRHQEWQTVSAKKDKKVIGKSSTIAPASTKAQTVPVGFTLARATNTTIGQLAFSSQGASQPASQ